MRELDMQVATQCRHASVDGKKEFIFVKIILRIKPFFLQLSPHRFGDIQMRRIGWKKEDVQSCLHCM